MFTGDNVLGHGTAVFEDLIVYLNSLSRMREQFKGRAYPGHVGEHFRLSSSSLGPNTESE